MGYDSYEIPDAIEPLVGFRGWLVKDGRLWSVNPELRAVEWPLGGLEAKCLPPSRTTVDSPNPLKPPPPHDRPIMDCTCGIYALHQYPEEWVAVGSRRRRATRPWPSSAIVGLVEGWGHMVLGTKGFRAEFARPVALEARPRSKKWTDIIEELAHIYKLDIVDTRELRLKGQADGHWDSRP